LDDQTRESRAAAPDTAESPEHSEDRAAGPAARPLQCEQCSGRARVHVLEGYVQGKPVHRHLCLDCAEDAYNQYLTGGSTGARPRPHLSTLMVLAGVLLVTLGAVVDLLGVEGQAGFGWKQQLGLGAGVLLVVLGALLRVDGLTICGGILLGLAVVADVWGLIGSPGLGWRQSAVILVGLVLILTGLHARNRRLRRMPGAA
jgi:hypothetical protein